MKPAIYDAFGSCLVVDGAVVRNTQVIGVNARRSYERKWRFFPLSIIRSSADPYSWSLGEAAIAVAAKGAVTYRVPETARITSPDWAEPMSTDTRDRRATEAVACPRCHAKPGELCRVDPATLNGPARPHTHSERREAYRQWRDKRGGLIV